MRSTLWRFIEEEPAFLDKKESVSANIIRIDSDHKNPGGSCDYLIVKPETV